MFQDLNPLDRSTATLEILIMLLVAFIIGFLIAWWLKRNKNSEVDYSSQLNDVENKNNTLKSTISALESEQQSIESKNAQLQHDLDTCLRSKEELINTGAASTVKEAPITEVSPITTTKTPTSSGSISESDRENAERLGFTAASESDRDDLTKISGVGPFIEKKLNGLGIYTFAQISSFTADTIDRVTKAIEFFPGRIQRDNWVGQAKEMK